MSAGASRVPVSSVASTRLVVDPAEGPSATHQCSALFQFVTLRKLGALAAWYRLAGSKLAPAADAEDDCTRKFRPLARCSYTASSLNRNRSGRVQPKAPRSATYILDLAVAAKGACMLALSVVRGVKDVPVMELEHRMVALLLSLLAD